MLDPQYLALIVVALIFLVGIVGTILPIIPGSLIVWSGILVHKLWLGDSSIGWKIVIITGVLMLIGQLADIFLGIWGARRFGASWKGATGAFIGAIVGIFIPPQPLWIILGPVIGAVLGELTAGRTLKEGGRAGFGTVVGAALAFALKFGLSLSIVALFFIALYL